MGTAISVDARDEGVGPEDLDAVFAWFRGVDDVFSTYKEDSQISRLGRGEISLGACDAEVTWVLETCQQLGEASAGYFDAYAAGFLDPSGLVKGWSVERASELLAARGSANHCINAGGDVRVRGEPDPGRGWHIGIAHPLVPRALTVVVAGRDLGVATSGIAEQGLHVLDPHTGRPAAALASVTVAGADLTWADGFATAALAMGLEAPTWLRQLDGYEAYVIDAGGHAWWTDGFVRYAPALRDV